MRKNRIEFKAVIKACTVVLAMLFAGCGGGGGSGGSGDRQTFTLNGTIQAPDNALIDSDVNDTSATYAPNDSFVDAQQLPNPVILGGYVNLAGEGPTGRSQTGGDQSDFFRVSLIEGQGITLFIASDPAQVDLDLYLYDDLQNPVDAAMGTGSQESLITPADGDYFIEVRAKVSASNYNLTIGQSTADNLTESLRLSDEFVPGENACKGTMKFKSVIGYGKATIINDDQQKRKALDFIMKQYTEGDKFHYSDKAVADCLIIKVDIESMTGKVSGY